VSHREVAGAHHHVEVVLAGQRQQNIGHRRFLAAKLDVESLVDDRRGEQVIRRSRQPCGFGNAGRNLERRRRLGKVRLCRQQ
jgi:hypothetical protein